MTSVVSNNLDDRIVDNQQSYSILSSDEERLLAKVRSLQEELREFLQTLVQTESVNPPGDTRRVAEVTYEKLQSFATDIKLVGPDPNCPNIMASLNPGNSPQLVFNSHMDTVPFGDLSHWTHSPLSGEVIEGSIHGRGSADAKGSLAAMIMAGKALVLSDLSLSGTLVINPVSDEEIGGINGAKWIVDNNLVSPDAVVIGEITSNRVAIAHKGIVWFRLVTHGRTAHASTPWEGVNAISHMITILSRIETEFTRRFSQINHPLTPPPSFNFGLINGGEKANVVADRCEVELDRRILPTENADDAIAEVEDILEAVRGEIPNLNAEVEVILVGDPVDTSESEVLVQEALGAAQALGLPGTPVGYQQGTDGRFFSAKGIPTIMIGPGVPEVAHTPDEHVAIEDVYQATELYALVAYRMLRS